MTDAFQNIPQLLHDATLTECNWDAQLKTLDLCFRCLRRDVDTARIADGTVDLRLGGVRRVAAYYSPTNITVKPSEFAPSHRITVDDLENWSATAMEAYLAINSSQADFDAATSCFQEVLVGDSDNLPGESPVRVHLSFDPRYYGHQLTIGLAIDCDTLQPFAGDVPFNVETWERQFEAWWAGWRTHWDSKDVESDDAQSLEDTFIPAGKSDPPDLSYRPPQAAPFLISPSTAPEELFRPIEDFHTGIHRRNWRMLAGAYPNFDRSRDEHAAHLQEIYLNWEFGRWDYIRCVDSWWCEGNRACVVVRGIEHCQGDDESPPCNKEVVIEYGLRKLARTWIIATWSRSRPKFGSADHLANPQPWRDGWNLTD